MHSKQGRLCSKPFGSHNHHFDLRSPAMRLQSSRLVVEHDFICQSFISFDEYHVWEREIAFKKCSGQWIILRYHDWGAHNYSVKTNFIWMDPPPQYSKHRRILTWQAETRGWLFKSSNSFLSTLSKHLMMVRITYYPRSPNASEYQGVTPAQTHNSSIRKISERHILRDQMYPFCFEYACPRK
jgi:hypothetical protein